MARHRRPSGTTLIEAMVAMAVLVLGTLGLVGLHRVGAIMNDDARRMARATALAQDLVDQMQLWDFTNDPRLVNTTTANDADFADGAQAFENPVGSFTFDHQESELGDPTSPYPWLGVSMADAQQFGGFTRYWNVAELDYDATGVLDAKRIAVIVRWEDHAGTSDGRARRVVLITALQNPSVTN